jgi:carboxymethylenebutenolidase
MMVQSVNARWMDAEDGARSFAYFVRPGSDQPSAGVLVLHEAFGLNADIRALCGRLAQDGYAALAPDLYWRRADRLAGYDERPKAIEMLKSRPDTQVLEDTARGLDLLQRKIDGVPLAVLGLRIGGRYSLLLAAHERRRISAAISYYGAGIDGGTISPLWSINAIQQVQDLSIPLLLFFVGDDPTVPSAEVESIEVQLRRSGTPYEIVRYPGVRPGFVFPGRDTYAEREAEDAWQRMVSFLDRLRTAKVPMSLRSAGPLICAQFVPNSGAFLITLEYSSARCRRDPCLRSQTFTRTYTHSGLGLKILVSAVQSRPSPPFVSRDSEDLHAAEFQRNLAGALDLARTCLVPRKRAVRET